jgi:endonuclease YncB( thermonuclease family)
MGHRRLLLLAVVAVFAVALSACRAGQVTYVVDGDTLDVEGVRIRIIGIDTPERGQCGYDQAKALVQQLVGGQGVVVLWNQGRQETDRYGRELGYVHRNDFDLGEVLLRYGLAKARYDSRDGYGWHERQDL